MKNKFILIVVLLMAMGMVYVRLSGLRPKYVEVKIGQAVIKAEVADTIGKQEKGLSGRKNLPAGDGMLFIFNPPSQAPFWMKEMHFPLDIIWFRDGKVVDLIENVPAPIGSEVPATVMSKEFATGVLEVNAGLAAKHNIKIGDIVEIF